MRAYQSRLFTVAGVLLALLVLAGLAAANGAIRLPWAPTEDKNGAGEAKASDRKSSDAKPKNLAVELVAQPPHTLLVPEDVRTALGIRKGDTDLIAIAKKPIDTRPLVMPGSTLLDPTRLMRIRALFAPSPSSAQVVQIGQVAEDPRLTGKTQTVFRELRSGDRVIKGNLLAAFYSVDVGNKKNDLIDSIYQLKLDSEILKRWTATSSVVPEVQLWNQRRAVQGDINAINRAVSTLRTWGIPEEDIQACRDEAEKVKPEDAEKRLRLHEKSDFDRWARVEIKAPEDGVILERTVGLHENIVDNTTNIFQLAKLEPDGTGPRLSPRDPWLYR
jgi:membrane fusion protein, heavy metal efflux system